MEEHGRHAHRYQDAQAQDRHGKALSMKMLVMLCPLHNTAGYHWGAGHQASPPTGR